jgi:hypothetical protein
MGEVITADKSQANAILSKTALRDTKSGACLACNGFFIPI